MLLDAHQQWTLAKLWAQQAKTLPSPWRERMIARAKLMANLASWQWTHPDDSQTVKTPCSPETLIEREFLPAMVAALTRGPFAGVRPSHSASEAGLHRAVRPIAPHSPSSA